VVAGIRTTPTFSVGTRQELFEDPYVVNADHTNYDVHPSTGQFVMIKSAEQPTDLVIALNWFQELIERTEGAAR
jgi:hypothetical protein